MIEFLFKIWGLARPYKGRFILGAITGIIAGLVEPVMVATITVVFQLFFPQAGSTIRMQTRWMPDFVSQWIQTVQQSLESGLKAHPGAIIALVCAIPAVMLVRGFFSYLNVYLLQWVAIRSITDLRIRLFEHLMRQSAVFYNRSNTGELMSRMMSDTGALIAVLSNVTGVIVKDPAKLISLLAYVLYREPKLTLISMIVLPLCLIPISVYGRKVRRSAGSMQTHLAEISGVIMESFTGNRIIKAYNLEGTVINQFRATAQKLIGHFMRIVRASEMPGQLMEIFGGVGVALVLLYLAYAGNGRADASALLTVVICIYSMYQPIKNLARLHNNLEQVRASSDRVFEMLASDHSIPEPANPKPLFAAGKDIEFENIEFDFGEKKVLKGINLTVKAGKFVALVGASGSGKTTLTNLLLRFYDPTHGSVRIGGIDIREVTSRDLRSQMAVVTQETVLFNETIRRNIEMGRPGVENGAIVDAAIHAHAHEFIKEKELGYETVIGERGVALSGGQRQRIAIARAIVKDAPILILDEATNALDAESERIVQTALEELMKGRTTLCIAHRLSTVQRADMIVVFDEGRIVETGRHDELIRQNGHYRRLYELQGQI